MLDRNFLAELFTDDYRELCLRQDVPRGEKAQHPVPISLRMDHATGLCSAGAVGGFRAAF